MIESLEERLNGVPEGADQTLLRPYLSELLSIRPLTFDDRYRILSFLWELGDRYWHTYEAMPAEDKIILEDYIRGFWVPDSIEAVETLGGIANQLGSRELLNILKSSKTDKIDQPICESISRIVNELGGLVDEPYRSLKTIKA